MAFISKILDRVKPSATLESGKRIAELRAAGRTVISLTAGQPDFDTPANIKAAAVAAIERGETKYTPVAGMRTLRDAIVRKLARENGLLYKWSETIVGTGGKQIIANAMLATVEPGDEVVIPAPFWVSYPELVALCGGSSVIVKTSAQTGYKLTPAQLEAAITARTKWVVLNSPSNPTGAVYTVEELRALADVLARHPHVWAMTDEIYEHLVYTGDTASSLVAVAPFLRDRTLVVNGVSKAYAMTGWRIGYGAGPEALICAMDVIQSQVTTNASSISQWAALEALNGNQAFLQGWRDVFRARRDLMLGLLAQMPGINCERPDGAFYVFPDCSHLFGRITKSGAVLHTGADFARELLEQEGVGVVGGDGFGAPENFRISYAFSEGALRDGCQGIARFCNSLEH